MPALVLLHKYLEDLYHLSGLELTIGNNQFFLEIPTIKVFPSHPKDILESRLLGEAENSQQ